MDANIWITLVSTVGFPIVMCGAMGWYVKYITDKNHEDMAREREQHDEEMKEITLAINNNTLALQKLSDMIGGIKHDFDRT